MLIAECRHVQKTATVKRGADWIRRRLIDFGNECRRQAHYIQKLFRAAAADQSGLTILVRNAINQCGADFLSRSPSCEARWTGDCCCLAKWMNRNEWARRLNLESLSPRLRRLSFVTLAKRRRAVAASFAPIKRVLINLSAAPVIEWCS